MGFFNDLIKFSKMVKNPSFFLESFFIDFLHLNKTEFEGYTDYMAKCFLFLKEFSQNKELVSSLNMRAGIVFESPAF
jgi:hypothetical protein